MGLATYPSSWTGGRVSKWTGGRKVSWHREQSVRRPKKDCDGKKYIRSVVQIFFVRVLFLVWVIACTRRVDVAGEGREKSAAKNLCENLLVVQNIIHGCTCQCSAQSCKEEANRQTRSCSESFEGDALHLCYFCGARLVPTLAAVGS